MMEDLTPEEIVRRREEAKQVIREQHNDGSCGGACIYCEEVLSNLAGGSYSRLLRVKKIRQCSTQAALEFCISTGWLAAEKLNRDRESVKLAQQIKNASKDERGN